MALFEILWKKSAEHDLRKIDHRYIPQILKAVEGLAKNPFLAKCRKLKGSESSYRIRIGDYRVIYQAYTRNNRVIVYHVRHRREAYR
ncbi:MAG: type II toxin-antitoxin system RelE/ParE family toxin [Acidobacteriota bacterium]|nr:type II toxin-antitoxin system RelE/ParE family toxin [Acidobacteriota bacterium]